MSDYNKAIITVAATIAVTPVDGSESTFTIDEQNREAARDVLFKAFREFAPENEDGDGAENEGQPGSPEEPNDQEVEKHWSEVASQGDVEDFRNKPGYSPDRTGGLT